MSHYSLEDRIFLVRSYYANEDNVTMALRNWSTAFKNRSKPSYGTVKNLISKFETTGNVKDDVEARKSKARTSVSPEIVDEVDEITNDEPTVSSRRVAQMVGTSQISVIKVMNKDLRKFPYKIQTVQRLSEDAITRRMFFASDTVELIDRKMLDSSKIIFSDEAHFWLDGYVNRQNYRIWGTQKPEVLNTKPLHQEKITVWCGLSAEGIIGPIFIEETVNADVYEGILEEYFLPWATDLGWMDGKHYFQQDGAPPHTTRANLAILHRFFGSQVLALKYPETFGKGMTWPPYSPDITPLDFFLWGYVKDRVYKKAPKTLTELKEAISDVIKSISVDMLEKVIGGFEKRLRMLIVTERPSTGGTSKTSYTESLRLPENFEPKNSIVHCV